MNSTPPIERSRFLQSLDLAVQTNAKSTTHLGLLLVDIDGMTRINHDLGYHHGDRLLNAVHEQLLSISRLPNSVFRVGDHRFAFIVHELQSPGFITLAMNRIQHVLAQSFFFDSDAENVEVKLGIAVALPADSTAFSVLARAETSLASMQRGEDISVEDIWNNLDAEEPAPHLEQQFYQALQNNGFDLYFQPQVNLRSGAVDSAEALLRWFPEGRAPVAPEVVVGLAEITNREYELTKWLVHTGLRQLHEWQDSPWKLRLSLNVEGGLVGGPDLPTLLRDALSIWGTQPEQVLVEITESAIIEDKDTGFSNLMELRDLGIRLSIDDFGTGYSSLSYFKHIPADELKIDKSFVTSLLTDRQDLELVKIILQLAHQFGLSVVAEGVEDEACLNMLMELGCDYAQGYYFSQPLPSAEFEQWLRDWPGLSDWTPGK